MNPLLHADPSTASGGASCPSGTTNDIAPLGMAASTNLKKNQIHVAMLLASKFNEKGAMLLVNGRCQEAIKFFRAALSQCKVVVLLHQNIPQEHSNAQLHLEQESNDIQQEGGQHEDDDANIDLQPDEHPHQLLVDHTSRTVRCASQTLVGDDSDFFSNNNRFVYREPFAFTFVEAEFCATESPTIAGSSSCCSSYSAATSLSILLLLNLAMAYHVSAVLEPEQSHSRETLRKALKLYGFAHRLQMKEDTTSRCCTSSTSTNLRTAMIILNNVGEIHRLAGDDSKHQTCLEYLLSMVMLMMDDRRRRPVPTTIGSTKEEEQILLDEGFVHNTLHLILRGIAAGAA